jgi:hypothetical protein
VTTSESLLLYVFEFFLIPFVGPVLRDTVVAVAVANHARTLAFCIAFW